MPAQQQRRASPGWSTGIRHNRQLASWSPDRAVLLSCGATRATRNPSNGQVNCQRISCPPPPPQGTACVEGQGPGKQLHAACTHPRSASCMCGAASTRWAQAPWPPCSQCRCRPPQSTWSKFDSGGWAPAQTPAGGEPQALCVRTAAVPWSGPTSRASQPGVTSCLSHWSQLSHLKKRTVQGRHEEGNGEGGVMDRCWQQQQHGRHELQDSTDGIPTSPTVECPRGMCTRRRSQRIPNKRPLGTGSTPAWPLKLRDPPTPENRQPEHQNHAHVPCSPELGIQLSCAALLCSGPPKPPGQMLWLQPAAALINKRPGQRWRPAHLSISVHTVNVGCVDLWGLGASSACGAPRAIHRMFRGPRVGHLEFR